MALLLEYRRCGLFGIRRDLHSLAWVAKSGCLRPSSLLLQSRLFCWTTLMLCLVHIGVAYQRPCVQTAASKAAIEGIASWSQTQQGAQASSNVNLVPSPCYP